MNHIWDAVDRLMNHPIVNLTVGSLLLIVALFELTDTVIESILGIDLKAAHAIALLGVVTMFRAIEELILGLERMHRARRGQGENRPTADRPNSRRDHRP